MSPIQRDLSKWLRTVVGSKEFPVLALQIKDRVNSENIHKPEDSQNMFGYKSGVKAVVDRIFELMIEFSEPPQEEKKLDEFSDDLNAPLG